MYTSMNFVFTRDLLVLLVLATEAAAQGGLVERQDSSPTPSIVSTIVIPAFRPPPTSTSSADARAQPSGQPNTMSSSSSQEAIGNGTLPVTASPDWGGNPTVLPDVPVTVVFAVLFLAGAVFHGWRYYSVVRASDASRIRPILSRLLVGFCLLRAAACCIRIAWTAQPSIGTGVAGPILLHIGSVVIFMANLMLGQRIIRCFSLASLSNSRWRFIVFWGSTALFVLGILSSIAIVVLYSAGASLAMLTSVPNSNSTEQLLQAGIAWLLAMGILPMLLVLTVVVTAGSLPSQPDRLGKRHIVFFLAGGMLVIGQGFHLAAINKIEIASGRVVFFVAGLALDVLVMLFYAVAHIDSLFSEQSFVTTTRLSELGNSKKGGGNRIFVRKSYKIEVDQIDARRASSPEAARRRSLSSDNASSRPSSHISELQMPAARVLSPVVLPTQQAGQERRAQPSRQTLEDRRQQASSPSPSGYSSSGTFQAAIVPYNPLDVGQSGRGGIKRLQAQLDRTERWMYLPEDERELY